MKRFGLLAALCCALARPAMAAPPYQGLPLTEALEELRSHGLDIVYSTRLVRPEMHVIDEPISIEPRHILDEILPPHGLRAEDGTGGRVLIVRRREEPEPVAEPVAVTSFRPFRFAETVEVVAGVTPRAVETNGIHLLPHDIESVAGSTDNVFRVVQTLPGVVTPSELGSRVAIRGGAPDQNLILMDGVEIYNPFRLYGFTSAFHPETVGRFDLSPGTFEPRYGDRLSSALVVENRVGRDDELFQGAVGASILDANVVLEGRLPKATGSWLVAGRRTYYDLAVDSALSSDFPSFGDFHTKFAWEPRPGQRLTFTGLVGSESTAISSTTFEQNDDPSTLTGDRFRLFATEDEVSQFDIENRARTRLFALNFESSIGSRAWSRTTLSYYRFRDAFHLDGLVESDARESRSLAEPLDAILFSRDVAIEDRALRQEFGVELGENHQFGAGFEFHDLATRWQYVSGGIRSFSEPNASGLSIDSLFLPGASLPERLDSTIDSRRWGFWFTDGFRLGDKLFLQPGMRVDRSGVNGKATVSPRFDASLDLRHDTRLRRRRGFFIKARDMKSSFSPTISSICRTNPHGSASTANAPSRWRSASIGHRLLASA